MINNKQIWMEDYRENPEDSPVAWCLKCQELIKVTDDVIVMKTVFRVEPTGLYPFGLCSVHKVPQYGK